MPTLTIDGRTVAVRAGATVLEAARQAGAQVPTLCHHPALEATGGCRLCVVDVQAPPAAGHGAGAPRMVVSCLYAAADGQVVSTASERVLATRRVVLDLLLARCPNTPLVQKLAREHGIERTSYRPKPKPTDCVLCGLCTRVCEQIGASAIAFAQRGSGREIAPPFHQPPPDCVGCLACAEICPTACIPAQSAGAVRSIWGKSFPMLRCKACGRPHLTEAQADLLSRRQRVPASHFELCDACKRQQLGRTAAALGATG